MSVVSENWHAKYPGGADSPSGLSFSKFWSQNWKIKSCLFCLEIGTHGILE